MDQELWQEEEVKVTPHTLWRLWQEHGIQWGMLGNNPIPAGIQGLPFNVGKGEDLAKQVRWWCVQCDGGVATLDDIGEHIRSCPGMHAPQCIGTGQRILGGH